ncbi:LuxR C-terminal-related transcriptional regulator [Streptosporangium sp. NPDC087985]|uniref:helix-turn-helix transcriptional regulator n=1 Tax=Streptosporangium sp. NPDC087985 TaxID=3366196 RepID=UPI0038131FD8
MLPAPRRPAQDVDAAQIYTILQTSSQLRVEEIAEQLNGEPENVWRCLRLLVDLGLLRYGEEGRFTVVRPETGMTILLSRAQAQLARSLAVDATSAAAGTPERGTAPASAGTAISSREWQVLQLLAQGCTDEAVARTLDVSLRTVRRVTADLMARLGARSRFQAGLNASRIFAERSLNRPPHMRPAHPNPHRQMDQSHGKRHHAAITAKR